MPFPTKDNLVHLGMSPFLANELENQVTSSNFTQLFGGSAPTAFLSSMNESGNIYRAIGNPFSQNAADTTEDTLAGIQIPASAFDVAGRGLMFTAQGKFGATGNNKRIRLWANPTIAGATLTNGVYSGGSVSGVGAGVILYDSGVVTTNAGTGWQVCVPLFKYGAAGSNTQWSQAQSITGGTHNGLSAMVFSTLPENAAINFLLTGGSTTTGAAGDVILNCFEVTGFN